MGLALLRALIIHIVGAVKANRGEWFVPPLTPTFVKQPPRSGGDDPEQAPDHRVGEQATSPGEDDHLGPVDRGRLDPEQPLGDKRRHRRLAELGQPGDCQTRRCRMPRRTHSSYRWLCVSSLATGGRGAALRQARGVPAGVADVPPPQAAEVAVRARPGAPPRAAQPVALVVAAPGGLRRGPVAHLVPVVARVPQQRVGQLVLVRLVVVLRGGDQAARTWAASLVPSSTTSAYADRWSGARSVAARRDRSQSASDSPGVPWMRSRLTWSPAARAPLTAASTLSGSCVRSRCAGHAGQPTASPRLTRVKPPSARKRPASPA